MTHLHSLHIIHADLKAQNVLLQVISRTWVQIAVPEFLTRSSIKCVSGEIRKDMHPIRCPFLILQSHKGNSCGVIAKISDFGLSLELDPGHTHVGKMYVGTITHMAPELLLKGQISKASDV